MRELAQTLIDGQDPNANGPADYADTRAKAIAGAGAAPYARTKWAGSKLTTDANGVFTMNLPAGLMQTGLAILGPMVRNGAGLISADATVTGSPAAGYAVTITFTKRKQMVNVPLPAVVLGAAATSVVVNLNELTAGVVLFDIGFAEPDVIGS